MRPDHDAHDLAEAHVPSRFRPDYRQLPEDQQRLLSESLAVDPVGAMADEEPGEVISVLATIAAARRAEVHSEAARVLNHALQSGHDEATAKDVARNLIAERENAIATDLELGLQSFEKAAARIFDKHEAERFGANSGAVRGYRRELEERAADPGAVTEWLEKAIKVRGVHDHALAAGVESTLRNLQPPARPEKRGGIGGKEDERRYYEAIERYKQVKAILASHLDASEPEPVKVARSTLDAIARARKGEHRFKKPGGYETLSL